MLEKRITLDTTDEEVTINEISPSDSILEKVASNEISEEIKDFIEKEIEKDPDYVYVLLSAVGSGEIWGDNVNHDYFEEEEIKKHYKSFEDFGHVFTHHKNKDPKNSKGDILFAHFNPRMHRVELVVRIERAKAPNVANDIDNDKMWDVSMGCKVPYDVCSICGNVAKTTSDYCTHINNNKGDILPDGRKVYMINKKPRFFDISFVYIGADRTAKSLLKIASQNKEAEIEKEVPGDVLSEDAGKIAATLMRGLEKFKNTEERISDEVLDKLSESPIENVLTSLMTIGVILKPEEFQRLYLRKIGYDPEEFDDIIITDKELPEPKSDYNPLSGEIDYSVLKLTLPYLEKRSALKPYLYPRLIKTASEEREGYVRKRRFKPSQLATPGIIAGSLIYKRYLDNVPDYSAEGLDKKVKENPWLLPAMTASSIGAVKGLSSMRRADDEFEKTASNLGGRMFAGVPAAYLASSIANRFDSDSKLIKFLQEHPNLVAMLGIGATNSKEDWEAIKKTIGEMSHEFEPMITKEAAEELSSSVQTSDLINDIDKLYNKYDKVDKKYNNIERLGNAFIYASNPAQLAGRGADMLAGSAVSKILKK